MLDAGLEAFDDFAVLPQRDGTGIGGGFQGKQFHYMMANPPYGVTWKKDKNFIENEALNPAGRFYAGTPRTSDGQLLFLQHMISKMDKTNG